jgi:glutamine transport system substrate-binding protein
MKKFGRLFLAEPDGIRPRIHHAVGCGGPTEVGEQDQNQSQVLRVGTNATFPPFEMQESGEFLGFDMDLIRAIGEEQGFTVEIKHMDFKALIPALGNDKIHAAIAGMSITPRRLESVDFHRRLFRCRSYYCCSEYQ